MAERLLHIEALEAGYGDIQVLWGVDLDLERGEIVCLVGSNGAGKTTLMRTISGLVAPRGGRVRFDGRDLTGRPPDEVLGAGIAHVPEGRRLFAALSVEDNLLMGAYLRTDKEAIRSDLEKVYGIFPRLAERRRQDAATLSGGEQQMCAIARGIMSRPVLLTVDELSLGLAPQAIDMLSEALLEINRSGVSILLVEQDVMIALELSHRGFVLDQGLVVTSGPSAELANDPTLREAYMGVT